MLAACHRHDVVIDPETHCQYLVGRNGYGITPRLKADGTPMCVK